MYDLVRVGRGIQVHVNFGLDVYECEIQYMLYCAIPRTKCNVYRRAKAWQRI